MSRSDQDVVELIKRAAAAVDAADIPSDLRGSAFRIAAEALSDGVQSRASKNAPKNGASQSDPVALRGDGDPLDAIARKLQLNVTPISTVFDVDDGGVHLTVSRGALDKSKRTAMREVALLIGAARQALGDEWTATTELRRAADDRGVMDAPNWAKALKSLDGHGFRFRGSGKMQEIKINQVGYEAAAKLVTRLTSGS